MLKTLLLFLGIFCIGLAECQTEIYSTDFQNGIPGNFTIVDNDGYTPEIVVSEFTEAWIPYVDPENINDSVAASTSYFNPPNTASRWLITPPLTLGSFGNFVEWQAKSHDASYPDDYLVLISTTDNQLSSFTDTIGYIIEENFEWATRQINLSAEGYIGQTVYLAFVNVTDDGFKLYLDDIRVWVEDPVTIDELKATSLLLYPNPVSNNLFIESSSPIEKVEIHDLNGNVIYVTSDKVLTLEYLPPGVYFVRISVNSEKITKRFIKI